MSKESAQPAVLQEDSNSKELEYGHQVQHNADSLPGHQKVLQRHGHAGHLVPFPSDNPQDPYNWASWRKHVLLVLVSFHAMMGPFSAAATIPAFESFVEDFGITITEASYTVSVPIIFLGVFPFLWSPISVRIGRRPVYLASCLISAACHFGAAYADSYATMITARVFQGIFLCPPQAIGAQTVGEMFFQHEKGQKLGVWTLMVTLGPPVAPFIFGFVVYNLSWHWVFYILALINLGQLALYVFLGPETLYDRPHRDEQGYDIIDPAHGDADPSTEKWYTPYITFKRHSRKPWSELPLDIVRPLYILFRPTIILPSLAYALAFTYSNVLLTIEIPALLGRKEGLNAQQTGLQFIAAIIGSVLGEPIAGWGSDQFMKWRVRKAGGVREPEMRLPFALPGFIISAVGVLVFSVQLANITPGSWNVTPLIGVGLALFGVQLVTTVNYTYAIESQPNYPGWPALNVALVRQVYAFTAPFYLVMMYENLGDPTAGGVLVILVAGVAFGMTLVCMLFGKKFRARDERVDAQRLGLK